jgi:hypothetical protein
MAISIYSSKHQPCQGSADPIQALDSFDYKGICRPTTDVPVRSPMQASMPSCYMHIPNSSERSSLRSSQLQYDTMLDTSSRTLNVIKLHAPALAEDHQAHSGIDLISVTKRKGQSHALGLDEDAHTFQPPKTYA